MRKNIIFSLILAVCVVILSFACVKTDATVKTNPKARESKVLTVAQTPESENPVLEARFLNMLNHNFVYNNDFYDDEALVQNSVLALLDMAEDSYIAETYVKDYIFNMYGKIYEGFESDKEGYLYVLPRGYSLYNHEIVKVTDNLDGSYTVITNVTISYEEGDTETLECETLFIEAEDSAFGYNMLYSDIAEEIVNASEC